MHILVLSTWSPYPPNNGSKIRAHYLVRALAQSHQVTLITFRADSIDDSASAGDAVPEIHSVSVNPYRYVSLPDLFKFLSPIPVAYWPISDMQRIVTKVAGTQRWEAVVAFQPPAARYALGVVATARILDVDTALSYQMYERHHKSGRGLNRFRTWIGWQKTRQYERRLFRKFHVNTVASPLELPHLLALLNGTSSLADVIPNGVDCQHNGLGLASAVPQTLVFNGSLTYSANYDAMQYFLGEIYPLIQRQVPEASLTITGSTAGVDWSGLRLDKSVHLVGYVEDIRPVVAGATVCVVPLRKGSGTRLKILEAMALGTPVISTSKGAEGLEVTADQEILLADSPKVFADQTVWLLHNPVQRQYLATNARRLVEQRYDWSRLGEHFVHLVEEAVASYLHGGDQP